MHVRRLDSVGDRVARFGLDSLGEQYSMTHWISWTIWGLALDSVGRHPIPYVSNFSAITKLFTGLFRDTL